MSDQRELIVNEARDWLETRWQHQASLKGVACDCIGLITGVARELGIKEAAQWDGDPRHGYGRQPEPGTLLAACADYLQPIQMNKVGLGDILLMRFRQDPQHFAIVSALGPMYIIHAYAQARRVVENRVDALWQSRIVRAYRFRAS